MSKDRKNLSQPGGIKENPRYWVIIPAAGVGKRMEASLPKQYLLLNNKTILEHTLQCFISHPLITKILLVLNSNDTIWPSLNFPHHEKLILVTGGERRCDSVLNALSHLQQFADDDDWVLVHDAVRPCLRHEDIDKLIEELADNRVGGLLGVPVRDTLKKVDENGKVIKTVDRENVWQALTPQMFRFGKLLNALQLAVSKDAATIPTDEAAAIELTGEKPMMIQGRHDNIKITYPEDLLLAELILSKVD